MNGHQEPGPHCEGGPGEAARYIPPHLRQSGSDGGGGGNNNFEGVERETRGGGYQGGGGYGYGGNRDYRGGEFRDNRG